MTLKKIVYADELIKNNECQEIVHEGQGFLKIEGKEIKRKLNCEKCEYAIARSGEIYFCKKRDVWVGHRSLAEIAFEKIKEIYEKYGRINIIATLTKPEGIIKCEGYNTPSYDIKMDPKTFGEVIKLMKENGIMFFG